MECLKTLFTILIELKIENRFAEGVYYMKTNEIKRCNTCILPINYPCITFNNQGVCNLCENYQAPTYLGIEQLKTDIGLILEKYPKRQFDCVIGLSGGRDSTYLLHILKKELKLNVLAYFNDHGYIPDHTKENVKKVTSTLAVPLIHNFHNKLEGCLTYQVKAWLRKPRPHSLCTLCMGCKSSIIRNSRFFPKKYQAPIHVAGWTPFEGARYKMNLLKQNSKTGGSLAIVKGYASEILKNPSLIGNFNSVLTQFDEFYTFYGPYKKLDSIVNHTVEILPFREYIRWIETDVVSTITKEYNWESFKDMKSTWRGDCYLGPVRQYLYKELLGYNDKTPHFSDLIRDKQLSRQEALNRLEEENVPQEVLNICCNAIGISYNDLKVAVRSSMGL